MSDDEFGISSGDEAEMAAAALLASTAKHPLGLEDAIRPAKRSKNASITTSDNCLLANRVLKERFGLDRFRLEQEAAITRLLDGGSAVVVFPTGGGKSLCYQVPAVAFRYQDQELGSRTPGQSGVSLVISPLIALMKDQVDALLRRGIYAAVLNSSSTRDEYLAVQNDLRNGRLDMIYCAPERLNSEGFTASLKAIPGGIRLLAVDEAHCISEWGHSFRPDYLKIARFAKEARVERVVCLTATATLRVARDIRDAFEIPEEALFRTTMYRPNLRLLAEANPKGIDYKAKLVVHIRKYPGPTIIYVTTQNATEKLADFLQKSGFEALPYHAGMSTELRTKTQNDFLVSKDMTVVATIAFGMGIDKPDIRSIVHFDIPDSIESYSQQIGRAGRDGKSSVCMFYLSKKDFHLRSIFTYGDRPSLRSLRLLMSTLCTPERTRLKAGETFMVSLNSLGRDTDIKSTVLGILFAQMELQFKLFRAAGSIYDRYKFVMKDPNVMLNDKSVEAKAIERASSQAIKWTRVALNDPADSSGLARSDLVRKLDEWNERGLIQLEKEGVQNMFRLERPLPSSPQEIEDIVNQLDASMAATELSNLNRTQDLLNLVTAKECYSQAIAEYFGDTGAGIPKKCGHCTYCETNEQVILPNEPSQPPDVAKVEELLSKVIIRDDPRFLAKIAFGIKSPRITAMKIYSLGIFDSMNLCDFNELLDVFTAVCAEEGAEA